MNKPMIVQVASSLLLAVVVAACPAGPGSGEGEGEGEPIGRDDCPEPDEGISVCALQSTGSDNHPRLDDAVVLAEVVATSQKFVFDRDDAGEPSILAVFVADAPMEPFGGVLVTFFADINAPSEIAIGDVLRVEGSYTEDSVNSPDTETRVRATLVSALGRTEDVTALEADADAFTSDDGEQYEGTLVEFRDVKVSALQQFFYTLDNGVNVSGKIFRYTALVDEEFAVIRGVVQYDVFAGGYLLTPRNAGDIESTFRPDLPTVPVTALNDGTVPRCLFTDFNGCKADIAGVVVSPVKFIETDDVRGPRFGFYVADPDNVDAQGRLQARSGIFVTISPASPTFTPVLDGYTFEQDGDRNFLPGAAPEIGDAVVISGQNNANFDNSEFRNVSFLQKGAAVVPPLPALFDGSLPAADMRHPNKLSGGRPDVTGNFGVADGYDPPLEGISPAAGLEDWEGVLVEIINAEVTTSCYESPFMGAGRDFGYFLVTGEVEIGNLFFIDQPFGGSWDVPVSQQTCAAVGNKCGDSRVQDAAIGVTGIINYSFNVHRVNPRTNDDIDAPLADFTGCD